MTGTEPNWLLSPVRASDATALLELTGNPGVYRYLFDGKAPDEDAVRGWIAHSTQDFRERGVGFWLLSSPARACGLCHPRSTGDRGRGRACLRAASGFLGSRGGDARGRRRNPERFAAGIERIVAGVDLPNAGSRRVLTRLGMRFERDVAYPLGAGMVFALGRDDARILPDIEPIAFARAANAVSGAQLPDAPL